MLRVGQKIKIVGPDKACRDQFRNSTGEVVELADYFSTPDKESVLVKVFDATGAVVAKRRFPESSLEPA